MEVVYYLPAGQRDQGTHDDQDLQDNHDEGQNDQ